MSKVRFPENFVWGCATSSFQVEGAALEGGRGESTWDRFCTVPGKISGGDNGVVSCDQYHRYREDVLLMKKAGIKSYRFSIAWPRLIPEGSGAVNPEGVAYYHHLIDALLEAGIEPSVTLYHWDLPQALQNTGGWANRATVFAFEEYAKQCFSEYGTKVRRWITLNEPLCEAYLGHLQGIHAPGIMDKKTAYDVVHHLNLAHGLAVRAFRASGLEGEIGITWNINIPKAASSSDNDKKAVQRIVDKDSRMFTGPVCGHGYPQAYLESEQITLPVQDGDMDLISQKIDFAGLNYYSEHVVSWDENIPGNVRFEPCWQEETDMGWPIVPQGFVRYLQWLEKESGGIPLYVTENGCAEDDVPSLGAEGRPRIHDKMRIDYLRSHIAACHEALQQGVPLKGYFVWSFIDNFEWSHGYSKRFGIVYCDYKTQNRIPKDSYYYYRDVINGYVE